MEPAHFAIALPDDPVVLNRLAAALAAQSDPRIAVSRSNEAVVGFSSDTGELMLRSRVMQALEVAVGPDWQRVVRLIG